MFWRISGVVRIHKIRTLARNGLRKYLPYQKRPTSFLLKIINICHMINIYQSIFYIYLKVLFTACKRFKLLTLMIDLLFATKIKKSYFNLLYVAQNGRPFEWFFLIQNFILNVWKLPWYSSSINWSIWLTEDDNTTVSKDNYKQGFDSSGEVKQNNSIDYNNTS